MSNLGLNNYMPFVFHQALLVHPFRLVEEHGALGSTLSFNCPFMLCFLFRHILPTVVNTKIRQKVNAAKEGYETGKPNNRYEIQSVNQCPFIYECASSCYFNSLLIVFVQLMLIFSLALLSLSAVTTTSWSLSLEDFLWPPSVA